MESTIRQARRIGLIAVGLVSALGALAAAWWLVVPESIGNVGTPVLVGLLAMLVLPGLTLVAWALERRAAHRSAVGTRPDVVRHEPAPLHAERTHRRLRPDAGPLQRAG